MKARPQRTMKARQYAAPSWLFLKELMQAEFAPTTGKACCETVVQGVSENAVSISRCRVLRRLRHELGGLVE